MRNAADAALLKSPAFRQKIAQGLAQAFADFLAGQ
jgi:N-acetylmuramoyl-L-alanine amidase